MSSILAELGKEFERASGDKLAIEYGSTTRIKSRVEADEAADLIINGAQSRGRDGYRRREHACGLLPSHLASLCAAARAEERDRG
jgi:hypothetical protein